MYLFDKLTAQRPISKSARIKKMKQNTEEGNLYNLNSDDDDDDDDDDYYYI
jgi:hypothetical protein